LGVPSAADHDARVFPAGETISTVLGRLTPAGLSTSEIAAGWVALASRPSRPAGGGDW
jgi:hypothetical protein